MLALFVVLFILALVLTAALWFGTLFLQSYFYTEPTKGIFWQAPLAACVLTFFFLFWSLLNVWGGTVVNGNPEIPYDILWKFSNRVDLNPEPVPEFESKKKTDEGYVYKREKMGKEIKYKREGSNEYWSSQAVEWVKFNYKGQEYKFEPTKTPQGGNKIFVDRENSWEMNEVNPGVASYNSFFRLFVYFFLNGLHLVLWIVCLWLVLRFSLPHAIGLGFVMWLLFTLALLPGLCSRAAAAVA